MKLVRYGPAGREKPGIVDADGKIRDLSRVVKDIDGEMLASGGIAKIKKANLKKLKVVPGKPRTSVQLAALDYLFSLVLSKKKAPWGS